MNTLTAITRRQRRHALRVLAARRHAAKQSMNPDPAPLTDLVDERGRQSFPASDPPANW